MYSKFADPALRSKYDGWKGITIFEAFCYTLLRPKYVGIRPTLL